MTVDEDRSAVRHHRLLPVALRHGDTESLEPTLLEILEDTVVKYHLSAEYLRDRRLGAVVCSGAEPARRDHGAGAFQCFTNGRGNVLGFVTNGSATHDANAQRGQLTRQVRGIGVDGETEKQFVADGDDFDVHARKITRGHHAAG